MKIWPSFWLTLLVACRPEPIGETVQCRTSDECEPGELCIDSVCMTTTPDVVDVAETDQEPDAATVDTTPPPDTTMPPSDTAGDVEPGDIQDTASQADTAGPPICRWDESLWDDGCVFGP